MTAPAPLATTCTCKDPDVIRLQTLIAGGMDQWEASRLLWGDPTPRSVRAWVRVQFVAAFPWLRMPEEVTP